MARNPYAGTGANDPYTNGNGTPTSNTGDYDPFGERYGTPPISTPASRPGLGERRPTRTGGYGGFYENGNGPSPAAQPPSRAIEDGGGDYFNDGERGGNLAPEQAQSRSPRRNAGGRGNERRYGDGSGDGSQDRGVVRRERYAAANGGYGGDAAGGGGRGLRNNSNVRGGAGDGTRQIEGQYESYMSFTHYFVCRLRRVPPSRRLLVVNLQCVCLHL